MVGLVIPAVFVKVFVMRLMVIMAVGAGRPVIFFPVVKPPMILMVFIPVSVCLLSMVWVIEAFGLFGSG